MTSLAISAVNPQAANPIEKKLLMEKKYTFVIIFQKLLDLQMFKK